MTIPSWFRYVGVVAAGMFLFPDPSPAQEAQKDPWKVLPPAPTTCFTDDYTGKLVAAQRQLNAEIDRQKKVNAAAKEKFDNMDMMEKAKRMQAFMMKNPEAAMKMMQAEQAAATSAHTSVKSANDAVKPLEAELERLHSSFIKAVDAAAAPVIEKQKALIKAKTIPVGEAQIAMFTNAADHAQYVQLVAEETAARERACAPYFGANGSMHKWLSRYRAEVVEKMVSIDDDNDSVITMQMSAMGFADGGYRSTGPLQQAINYANKAEQVYRIRQPKPRASVELRK